MRFELICQHCGTSYTRPRHAVLKGSRFCSNPCRIAAATLAEKRPAAERFWEKVEKREPNDCWNWAAGCFADGYGALNVDRKPVRAHRFSYLLAHGTCPDDMDVLHSCDNPKCVNPAHLSLGTHIDNMAEMAARGRNARTFKVTDEQVLAIRASLKSLVEIAAEYGISVGLVGLIRGKAAHRVPGGRAASRRKELALAGVVRPRKP